VADAGAGLREAMGEKSEKPGVRAEVTLVEVGDEIS
jgi:hypothetical protein